MPENLTGSEGTTYTQSHVKAQGLSRRLAKKQLRRPRNREYSEDDIERLLAIKHARKVTLPEVHAMAVRAELAARRTQGHLDRICAALVLEPPKGPLSTEELRALWVRVNRDLRRRRPFSLEEIETWTKQFVAIDEAVLHGLRRHTENEQPWLPFVRLGMRIMGEQSIGRMTVSAKYTLQAFDYARRNLRNAAFTYSAETQGMYRTRKAFLQTDDQRILSLAHQP